MITKILVAGPAGVHLMEDNIKKDLKEIGLGYELDTSGSG
jgi:hypothetical protein